MTGDAWQQRQSFLLRLSDALRPLSNPVDIQNAATRETMIFFGADRCYYGEIVGEKAVIRRDAARGDLPSVAGTYPLSRFALFDAAIRAGKPLVVEDVQRSEVIDEPLRQLCLSLGVISFIDIPVIKQGEAVGLLCLVQGQPRAWTELEVELAAEVAERLWMAVERAKAEESLRNSEENYRTLFDSIDEGFCTIEVLFDGQGQAFDYCFLSMNPAFEGQTGLKEATGRTIREFAPQHEPFWFEVYGEIALTGEAKRFEHQAEALTPPRYYDVYAFRIGEAEQRRVAVLFNDISVRKRAEEALRELNTTLEERVQERTRRIADLNAELGAFIRRTARNLEAPARKLAEWLDPARPVQDGLPPYDPAQLQDELQRLSSVAQTIRQLSRLEQDELQLEPVALGELLQELRAERPEAETGAHWTVQPLPIVRADRNLLRQALSAALDFSLSPTRNTTHLEISAQNDDGEVLLHLWDDGLGLSPEEASTLFDLMIRSDQSVPVLPGSGLAQVRRILARHGGWAWAEAHLRGGKITLALPRDEGTHEMDQWLNRLSGN